MSNIEYKVMEKINDGRKASLVWDVVSEMVDRMKDDAVNNIVNEFRAGKVNDLSVAKMVAAEDVRIYFEQQIKKLESNAKKL